MKVTFRVVSFEIVSLIKRSDNTNLSTVLHKRARMTSNILTQST
jgi:hypothetical protein